MQDRHLQVGGSLEIILVERIFLLVESLEDSGGG
jgi:hypothetical protein